MDSIPWGEFTDLIYWNAERSIIVSLQLRISTCYAQLWKLKQRTNQNFKKFTCIEILRQTLNYNAPSLQEKDDCVS